MRATLAAAAALLAAPALAQQAPDGREIAERWCAGCHVVAPDQPTTGDAAPAFAALAERRTDAQLAGWITAPHPPMPDPGLSRAQIRAVTAYIRSLDR